MTEALENIPSKLSAEDQRSPLGRIDLAKTPQEAEREFTFDDLSTKREIGSAVLAIVLGLPLDRTTVLERSSETQPRFEAKTTDPADHDPNNFRYLVHALSPGAKGCAMYILAKSSDGINPLHGDQSINMYDEPERVARRVSLSMSLIDQDHTATWGGGGLIISAPEENIVLASEIDAGAHNNDKNSLLRQGATKGVLSADQLLDNTSPRLYNEVVALANSDGSKLETIGFFYKVTSKGEPIDPVIARRMRMHAERLGLPIVEIPQEKRYGQDGVNRRTSDDQEPIAIVYSGEWYSMLDYQIYDEAAHPRFASPEEMAAALRFAVDSGGMSEAEAQRIMDDYTEAHERRMTPTAYYDYKGNFEKIEYFKGYGKDELKFTIDSSGHGDKVNTEYSQMNDTEVKLSSAPSRSEGYGSPIPISPFKADTMVQRAKEGLDKARADELQRWYDEHREVVERDWRRHQQSGRTGSGGYGIVR